MHLETCFKTSRQKLCIPNVIYFVKGEGVSLRVLLGCLLWETLNLNFTCCPCPAEYESIVKMLIDFVYLGLIHTLNI